MATPSNHRSNGTHKNTPKTDRLLSINSSTKSSALKCKPAPPSQPVSALRRNSPASVGGSKDDPGGLSFVVIILSYYRWVLEIAF